MANTLNQFQALGAAEYSEFPMAVADVLQEALFTCVEKWLAQKMSAAVKNGEEAVASLTLDWGTYTASLDSRGAFVIDFVPRQEFVNAVKNGGKPRDTMTMKTDDYDADYINLIIDAVLSGTEFLDDEDGNKGLKLTDTQVRHNISLYGESIAQLAIDKVRKDKVWKCPIAGGNFDHGTFEFAFGDDEVTIKFTPSKVFKQALKDDASAIGGASETTKDAEASHNLDAGISYNRIPAKLVLKNSIS